MLIRKSFFFLLVLLCSGLNAQRYSLPIVTNLSADLLDTNSVVLTSNFTDEIDFYHHHLFFKGGDRFVGGVGLLSNDDIIGRDVLYFEGYVNLLRNADNAISIGVKNVKIDGVDDIFGFPEILLTIGGPKAHVNLGYSIGINYTESDLEAFATLDFIYTYAGLRADIVARLKPNLHLFINNNISKIGGDDFLLFNKIGIQGEISNVLLRAGFFNYLNLSDFDLDNSNKSLFLGGGYMF